MLWVKSMRLSYPKTKTKVKVKRKKMVIDKPIVRQRISEEQLSQYMIALLNEKLITNDSTYIQIAKAIKLKFDVFVPKAQLDNYFEPNLAEEATDADLMFKKIS